MDAARCHDPTARQALTFMESFHSALKKLLAADPQEKARAAQWALEYEEKNKSRPVAAWIARHGIKAFDGGAKPLPDAEWANERLRIRTEFAAASAR